MNPRFIPPGTARRGSRAGRTVRERALALLFFEFVAVALVSLSACEDRQLEPRRATLTGGTARPNRHATALALASPAGHEPIDRELLQLERILRERPRELDAWLLLGRTWVRKARQAGDPGYYLNADACVDRALAIAPESSAALDLRGLVLLNAHRFDAARALAEAILERDRDDPVAWGILSDAALELGNVEEAMRAAAEMMNQKPNLPSYTRMSYLGWLHGDVEGAIRTIRLAIDAGSGGRDTEVLAWTLVQAALLFWHRGDYSGADAGFEQALHVAHDYPPALIGRGRCALARGEHDRAERWFARAFSRTASVEAAWRLGDARSAQGNRAGADAAFTLAERAGQHDPRTLSLFYSTRGEQPRRALSLARQEAKTRGGIYTLDALAWAEYRNGRFTRALTAIESARRLGTPDALLLYHHGAILLALGKVAAGRSLIARALDLNPEFDFTAAREARALLSQIGAPSDLRN